MAEPIMTLQEAASSIAKLNLRTRVCIMLGAIAVTTTLWLLPRPLVDAGSALQLLALFLYVGFSGVPTTQETLVSDFKDIQLESDLADNDELLLLARENQVCDLQAQVDDLQDLIFELDQQLETSEAYTRSLESDVVGSRKEVPEVTYRRCDRRTSVYIADMAGPRPPLQV
ncbi:hypothetical protein SDRG_04377 [Saprolegnia diclina VS20]|uniref:Uncharacterized protein n=1 Tax=Saprolegnia diclina (strain VS20) TaxID=1156394 RepID=T0QVH8_SAPDV|nr:hypothetical protein SDRG_04377 [Saprolegnia diclina VS20]EQC38681.1 hypothetical protein SDRG_04377 [Saprolegnia diclina VS20]|eukprot:XP_008608273.1 hypothetical protein SDRG_04377 [Saprolegnia diclina VS20]